MAVVYVGLSGGVDSSVTAALLLEAGHDVVGVYMKNWTQDLPGMKCPWAEDLADAKRIAVQLDIPFKVYDFEQQYRDVVVGYMVEEYTLGRTPNPDIMCNQEIKFKLFMEAALRDGAEMIATGHYARTRNGRLFTAKDTAKDQTYFLYRVTHEALKRTLFPLGDLLKSEVREIAQRKKLITAQKKDSQGICFVGSVGIKEFLMQYTSPKPGPVIDRESHETIGYHEGALLYTIGQRHGLGLGGGLPYYVVDKDMATNTVVVSRNLNDTAMWRPSFGLRAIHWIDRDPATDDALEVRLRHRGQRIPATLQGDKVLLEHAERAIAPGQSAVVYCKDEVLGGGIISD